MTMEPSRMFRTSVVLCAVLFMACRLCPAADVTFYSFGDSHYGSLAGETGWVYRINAMTGTTFAAGLGGGPVAPARGVIALGDLIDTAGNYTAGTNQWAYWKSDFGVNGEGTCIYPLYENFGNHDLAATRFVQKDIITRNLTRPGLTAISSNGLHYSWDWDGVHFLALGIYPADTWVSDNTFSSIHDPEYSLAFLKSELANNVGDSGRPIITTHHYDFFMGWWPIRQELAYTRELDGYNVVLILHGHQGAAYGYDFQGYTVVGENGSLNVCHITSNNTIQTATSTGLNAWGNTYSKSFTMPDLGKTWNPVPRNGHRNVTTNTAQIAWRLGAYVVSQDVYFSTSSNTVATSTTPSIGGLGATVSNCAIPAAYLPLQPGTEYFWRADEHNGTNSSFSKGKVWSFRTKDVVKTNDLTFLFVSDIHYQDETLIATKRTVIAMNGIPGAAYPPAWGGTVETPRGLVFGGDSASDAKQWQYDYYLGDYGLTGNKLLEYPVAGENNGNHDGGLPGIVADSIVARNRSRTDIANISSNGLHISWDWNGVHFVTLGVRPGANTNPYNSHGSLEFLISDLATNVGSSGRAVVLFQHFGLDDYAKSWWTDAERARYYDAIKDYNVIGIFHGHTHSCTIYQWQGIDVYNAPHMEFNGSLTVPVTSKEGFFVARITSNRFTVAERTADGTWGLNSSKPIFLSYDASGLGAVVNNGSGATNIMAGEATLTGKLVYEAAAGAPTRVTIYWGPTDGGTNPNAWARSASVGICTTGTFAASISGLNALQTYYYRCFATNSVGTDWAETSVSFQTLAAADIDNASGATGLGLYTATLNGTLTVTNSAPTYVSVFWGLTDGGTNQAAWSKQIAMGARGLGSFSTNISGLGSNTVYYYRCFASNVTGYVWADASASFQTWSFVTVNNGSGATGVTTNTATLNGNLIYSSGPTPQVQVYWGPGDGGTTSSAWSRVIDLGSRSAGTFSTAISGLTPAGKYWYRSHATSPAGDAWAVSSTAFYAEPLPVTNVVFSDADANVIRVTWTTNASPGFLVVLRKAEPVNAAPDDGASYTANVVFGSGTQLGSGNYVVYAGAGNTVLVTNLATRTVYHVAVYAYAGSGSEVNYQQDTPATGYEHTLGPIAAPSLSLPTATAIGTTDATLGARIDSDGGSPVVCWGTTWDTVPGTTNHMLTVSSVTNGRFGHVRTGFSSASHYYSRGWASNVVGQCFTVSDAEFYTEPLPASSVSFSTVTNDRMTIGWSSGNGTGRIAVVKQGSPVTNVPVDGIAYTAAEAFKSGTDLGGGEYVVYAGTGNGVTVTGLLSATAYHVAVFEYSGDDNVLLRNYQQDTPATGSVMTTFIPKVFYWDAGNNGTNWNNETNWYNATEGVNDHDFPNAPGYIAYQRSGDPYIGNTPGLRLNQDITVGQMLFEKSSGDNVTISAGTPVGKIIFDNRGSEALLQYTKNGADKLTIAVNPAIELRDNLLVNVYSDRSGNAFNGMISDPAGETNMIRIRMRGLANGTAAFSFSASNTYRGGTVILSAGGQLASVKGNAHSSFGRGNVTVQTNALLWLNNFNNIDNGASLYLESDNGRYARVLLATGLNETINKLYSNNVQLAAGTYGALNSSATYKDANFFSNIVNAGILTVLSGPVQGGAAASAVDITNADTTVSYLVTTCRIGGTNNAAVVGGMRWTNTLAQTFGTLDATISWTIAGIGLNVGSNIIVVSGSNVVGAIAADTVTVVRSQAQPGQLAPFTDVTTTPVTVSYDVTSYAVAGTNNQHVMGGMWATNATAGGARQPFAAASPWAAPGLGLAVGTNVIVVYGTNALNVLTNDSVVIVRSAYAQANVEKFEVGRGAQYGQVSLSWSNGTITVLACTNRSYTSYMSYWFTLTNGVSSPWTHTAATNFASVYYRIVSGSYTSAYDVGKFDVDIAAGSIVWLSFPFAPQPGCDTLGEWMDRQLQARRYNTYSYPMLQVQNGLGGSVVTRSYYIDNYGGGTTNWFPGDEPIMPNAGYVLFLAQDHPATKLTSMGMVPTNGVTLKVPYQTIPWVGLSYPSSVDMRASGITNLFSPPKKYSSFDYDFVDSQEVMGGPVWYAEYFIDDWGGGTTNFFIDAAGADKLEAGKGYLLFFSTTRTQTGIWTWVKPY